MKLSKGGHQSFEEKVQTLLPLYKEVFQALVDAGAEYIQVDEPVLVTDESEAYEAITRGAYDYFDKAGLADKLVIQTYFERANVKFLSSLPVGGLGLDFVHDNGYNLKKLNQVTSIHLKHYMQVLLMAVTCGLQISKPKKKLIETLQGHAKHIVIQPSSSLLHVPVSLDDETFRAINRRRFKFCH